MSVTTRRASDSADAAAPWDRYAAERLEKKTWLRLSIDMAWCHQPQQHAGQHAHAVGVGPRQSSGCAAGGGAVGHTCEYNLMASAHSPALKALFPPSFSLSESAFCSAVSSFSLGVAFVAPLPAPALALAGAFAGADIVTQGVALMHRHTRRAHAACLSRLPAHGLQSCVGAAAVTARL